MSDKNSGIPTREEFKEVLDLVLEETMAYLSGVDERPVRSAGSEAAVAAFDLPFPEKGLGAAAALRRLIDEGFEASVASSGPRNFHFVIGGTTPAALGGDWLASALDQIPYAWVTSPLAVKLELISLDWLREAFELPPGWGGIMTTGATMANFVGFGAARQWWGEKHGIDVAEAGLAGAPQVPILSSGYIHASAVKCFSMLGMGRASVHKFARNDIGQLDVDAMRKELMALKGAPAIIVGNAGEVNAGDFDPIETLADLAEEFECWLHVDGAFGLFARLSKTSAHLTAGIDRAHSITVDGHKWLNVPYDCGFALVRDPSRLPRVFHYVADYLPKLDDPHPNMGIIGPESSRRARSFSVWATLAAYGRRGLKAMVENHLALAQHLATLVDEASDLERLAEVPLNIVCFRFNPGKLDEAVLNKLNQKLGEAIIEDGRVYVGTTQYGSVTALRPAIVNWRMRAQDIEYFVDVVRDVGNRILKAA